MRFYQYLLLAVFLGLSGCYCDGTQTINRAREVLGDETPRELHKFVEYNSQESQTTTRFFLVFGSSNNSSQTEPMVKFSWRMSDGAYAFSTLPLEKIRVRYDESVEQPRILFKLFPADDVHNDCNDSESDDIDHLIRATVSYATVFTRASDWPVNVQLPLN